MIRQFFKWLEDWTFGDDNMFLGMGKFALVVLVFTAIIIGPFIYADATAPAFTLQKAEWSCVQSHEESHLVLVGKILVPQAETVCDEYRRVSGRP